MAEPICEDEGLMQEWCPETQLLQQIPLKIQRGLFSHNLNLTCLDVLPEYIAIGTNLGLVYWYYRVSGELQRLRLENSNCEITCVRVVSTVEYMVAAGTNHGTVTVFQIPKIVPDSIPDQLKPKQKQIERFTINGLHNAPITNVEWSQNGMKLFSGDKNGVVVLTEIDFAMHLSKSMELLNEQFEIIQLSYCQQILLISTVYRSIICDGSNNWKVHQVGTKERKILGKFGATFCKFDHGLVLYASRPGHRLWLAEKSGLVQQTLIFKSAVQSTCPKIQLINPVNKKEPYDTSFGKVIQFGDNKLITYNSEVLYVLHPGAVSVVAVMNNARKILDLAVNDNEVFILEGERSLLRISPVPDKYSFDLLYQPISRRTSFNLDDLAAKLKNTAVGSIKKITKDLIVNPEQSFPTTPAPVADEALELPPIVILPQGAMSGIYTEDEIEIHSSVENNHLPNWASSLNNGSTTDFAGKISQFSGSSLSTSLTPFNQDFQEEVITRPLRKRHNKKPKNLLTAHVLESESDTISNASEDRMVWGVANDMSLSDESAISQSQSSFSVLRDIPTLLNPQKTPSRQPELSNDDATKVSDTKSQTSLDTCESVSEGMLLTPEKFREEQEKVFARLANQSLMDSFNSERTDNMSISLNMTTSSSVSSKISENFPSPSDTSENSSMVSRAKTTDSQSTDNFENESQSLPKDVTFWNNSCNFMKDNTISSQEEKATISTESSVSSRNSQRERLYSKWSSNEDPRNVASTSGTQLENKSFSEPEINETYIDRMNGSFDANVFYGDDANINGPSNMDNEIFESVQDFGTGNFSITQGRLELNNCLKKFSETGQFFITERNINEFRESKEQEKKDNDIGNKPFSSLEPLGYGPPSGSSLLSSQPSSDFSSIPGNSQTAQPQIRDNSDHWPQYKTPELITSLDVSDNYVICTDVEDIVYYSDLSGLALSWTLLDYQASVVKVSNDGTIVWLYNKKNIITLLNPSQKDPISSSFAEVAQNVKSFAIDSSNNEGWIVQTSGKILHVYDLQQNSTRKSLEFPCDWIVIDIVSANGLIVALTENNTVICKPPKENNFRPIKTSTPYTTSVALGPGNLLWTVNDKNNIYFSDDFLSDNPQWWQLQISDYIFQNSSTTFQKICSKIKLKANVYMKNSLVATNGNSVWIFDRFGSSVRVNKTDFTGYLWEKLYHVKLPPNIRWQALSAEGVFEDKGHVWLLSLDGNIFCTSPNTEKFQAISVPCEDNVLCLASSANTLWVLSESGRIYSRLGLTDGNISGNSWRELRLPQFDNLRLIWVSCGCDVAWGCDIHGRIFITIGSPHHMATNIFDAAWLEVEGRPKGVQFEKVFVGPQLYMVWAIDNKGGLYVREGIFPHFQIGTSWVFVGGIEAIHVTISGTSVWALASDGNIYRRCGISESNYIGDYWKGIPGTMKMITSSFTDELWGVNPDNEILHLKHKTQILCIGKESTKETHSSKEDISWEIVE